MKRASPHETTNNAAKMRSTPERLSPPAFRILTHNIRYAATSRAKGEDPWEVRRNHLTNELRFNTRFCPESFICLQEVLHEQLVDIHRDLNKGGDSWEYIGVGRDDGKQAGEYSPIFYRSDVWELKFSETVWISQTPGKPSKGWDAASIRILTIGWFKDKKSLKSLTAVNTHLDDQGAESRQRAAEMILDFFSPYKSPVFVTGDFNSPPGDGAYQKMTGPGSPFVDLRSMIPKREWYGHDHTFSGFDDQTEPMTRLDFIFLDQGTQAGVRKWNVDSYAVLENRYEDQVYLSDHRAVVGDVSLA